MAQLEQRITEEMSQYQGLWKQQEGKRSWTFSCPFQGVRIRNSPDVQMGSVSVEGKDIRIDGRTASFEAVDRLPAGSPRLGSSENIKLVGARMDKKDNAVTFNFALEKH